MFIDYGKKYLRRKFSFGKVRFTFTDLLLDLLSLFLQLPTRVKKDKMVSCGAPRRTNWADNNSNITILVTIIIMLLCYYNYIQHMRTPTYLMSEAYSKPFQISKMTENPDMVRTVYSGILRDIQRY